jgi:hypothetical protein
LYLLGRVLFQNRWQAVLAAVAYSFFPSPAYAMETWRTIAKPYGYAPWGFVALIGYDEAAHAFGFAFALVSLAAAWERRWVLASVLAGVVFLINWPALIGLLALLAALALARREWWEVVGVGGTAYGLSAFWMSPGYFVSSSLLNRIVLRHTLTSVPLSGLSWIIFAVASLLLVVAWWKKSFLLAWVAITGVVIVSFTLAGNYLMPSPHRYMLEFNAGCVLLLAGLVKKYQPVVIVLGLALSWNVLAHVWVVQPEPQDPKTGAAYQVARWLNQFAKGSRVFVSGELDSTLPLWSDVAQVGGSGQDVSNFMMWAAERQIAFGCGVGSEPIAELWLRALNVKYFVVHEARSAEYFHWFSQPEKFRGQMKVAWENGAGDVIYEVPVDPPSLRPMKNTADAAFLESYVAWAAGKPGGKTNLVHWNWDPGWRGEKDPIGYLLTNEPGQKYGVPWDLWLGRAITVITVLLLAMGQTRRTPRVPGLTWIAAVAVVPAILAYAILLPLHSPEEEAFVRLQPPLINPGGIVFSGRDKPVSVYALNVGEHPKVWLDDREVPVTFHGNQMVQFQVPADVTGKVAVSIESNGCRGNEFMLDPAETAPR